MLLDLFLILIGTGALFYGADRLVAGSSAIALRTGIPPLLVGLTIVSLATSSPELVVSLQAAFQGNPTIALGNVVGSNIANIALVLGATALINPIKCKRSTINVEMPIMIGCVLLLFLLMYNHMITRQEGILLVGLLIVLILYQVRSAQGQIYTKKDPEIDEIIKNKSVKPWLAVVYVIGGTLLLVFGSDWFLSGAVGLGTYFGISDAVIGLTVVSVGTSLPELATTLVAAWKKESDIALGNIIGSNIYNVLVVLGITASVHPLSGGDITWIDLGVMLGVSVVLWPMMKFGMQISRGEGGFFLFIYIAYLVYLFNTGAAG